MKIRSSKAATARTPKKRAPDESYDTDADNLLREEEPVEKKARQAKIPAKLARGTKSTATKTLSKPEWAIIPHLCQVAKPFLIATFESIAGAPHIEADVLRLFLETTQQRTNALWDSLHDTPWEYDHDIALAALTASLRPIKLVDLAENDADFSAKALQAIVDLFHRVGSLNVSRVLRATMNACCMLLWKELSETPWDGSIETDVACAALGAYLDPVLLAGSEVRSTPLSAIAVLQHCVTKQTARVLWRLLPKSVQRVTCVSFEALKIGAITFRQMHSSVKTEEALLAGLREGRFSWNSLPQQMKQNLEYALAIHPDDPLTSFTEVWQVVVSEEKDRLWTELALQQPLRILPSHWLRAPDSVRDNADFMKSMVKHQVSFVSFISDRLASDFEFIDAIVAQELRALIWLPKITFASLPHILNDSTLKALNFFDWTNMREVLRAFTTRLSEEHHWSNRHFVLSFALRMIDVPDRFRNSKDKELLKVLVVGCRWKREQVDSNPIFCVGGAMDPDLQICLELLRFGEYQDVCRCFVDSQFTRNNYKVWVAKQRYTDRCAGTVGPGEAIFPAKALLQLQTFHGCFVFLCGVKHGDCLLRKLDHAGVKSEIASYLDFPKGLELEDLLVAAPKVAPSFSVFHPYVDKTIGKERGAELVQSLDLVPYKNQYGYSYTVDQLVNKLADYDDEDETNDDETNDNSV
jgi:hypothetical protein